MPIIIGGLIVLLQVSVIFHAMKTRRPSYWIFIIMGFPILGCVIYFAIEMLPGSRSERGLTKFGKDIVKAINPDGDMKRQAEELAICGSVENKMKMARRVGRARHVRRGDRPVQESARGPVLVRIGSALHFARAKFFNGEHLDARKLLGECRSRRRATIPRKWR